MLLLHLKSFSKEATEFFYTEEVACLVLNTVPSLSSSETRGLSLHLNLTDVFLSLKEDAEGLSSSLPHRFLVPSDSQPAPGTFVQDTA